MICVVVPFDPTENLVERLNQAGAKVYTWSSPIAHAYFVSYKGTTRELADKIGFEDNRKSEGVVVAVSSYSGYADKDLWEWLKEQVGK